MEDIRESMKKKRVYLAGPEVFLSEALQIAEVKKQVCKEFGLIGVFPLDNTLRVRSLSKRRAGLRISACNEELMRSCDAIIANMTPFRGPSADPGTAYEMGFMRGLEKPVFAYSNDSRLFKERTREYCIAKEARRKDEVRLEDENGMVIEDYDLADNLMLIGAIHSSGGAIVVADVPSPERQTNLTAFRACVQQAAQVLAARQARRIR